jgi:hypothetical protein
VCVCVYVCVCVCVCVREREGGREGGRESVRFGHKGTFINPNPVDCVLHVITCRLCLKLNVSLYFIHTLFGCHEEQGCRYVTSGNKEKRLC